MQRQTVLGPLAAGTWCAAAVLIEAVLLVLSIEPGWGEAQTILVVLGGPAFVWLVAMLAAALLSG